MFNFFKGFFGSSDPDDPPKNFNRREHFLREDDDPFSSRSFFDDHDDHFNVFSNPLEMHRYFESQLNSMLKSFGITGDGVFMGFDEGPNPFSNFLEGPEQPQAPAEDSLRDHFLKPGYEKPQYGIQEKSDSDIDGKINPRNFDSIFSDKNQQIETYVPKPKIHIFGKQMFTKSFTDSNGMVRSQQTIKDNEGNVETKETYRRGNKEYTKVTTTDKNGQQEIKENFVNMSENDLGNFLGGQNSIQDSPSILERKHPSWFPFDKYFK